MGTGLTKNEQDTEIRIQRQLGGEVMIWAGHIGGTFIGPVRGPKVLEIISRPFITSWRSVFSLFDQQIPATQRALIFQQEYAPRHVSK